MSSGFEMQEAAEDLARQAGKSLILLVDDSPDIVALLCRALGR